MKSVLESPQLQETSHPPLEMAEPEKESILHELESILESRFFRSAGRCKQFLNYIVHHKLDGHTEPLKERTIGTEVFSRPPGYATGEDPVVRVQAGEVRRRLEQYYQTDTSNSTVRIELPIGSYTPVFQRRQATVAHVEAPLAVAVSESIPPETVAPQRADMQRFWPVGVALALLLAVGAGFAWFSRPSPQKTAINLFWAPIFTTQQPLLICLAMPVAYRPTEEIYRRYSSTHPGTFQTEADRSNQPLPLDPSEKLTWGDLFVYADYGVAAGDVYAATTISGLMGKMDKTSQLRIGNNYTYEDLRNSPAVVVGGFNNKWTMQLVSNLHFALVEDHEHYMIREQGPQGREWKTRRGARGETLEDFGVVTRQLDSKTGQFTVTVAGIGPKATQAAGELVATPRYLADALENAPANWQKQNMQIVLRTTVTDDVAGPPQAVAAYFW